MRRRSKRVPHVSPDRWLVSYADFITLLFAFFTTMYAVSTVDSHKLSIMVASMQAAFARGDPSATIRSRPGTPGPRVAPVTASNGTTEPKGAGAALTADELRAKLAARVRHHVDRGMVDIEVDPRGLVVSLREAGSFETGSAALAPQAQAVLAEIADALRDVDNRLRVEGHTDDVPIRTERYGSNWELSTARATSVVAFFLAQGVSASRLSAAGYAEYHPRVPNATDAGRARNRRVDVIVLDPATIARDEPGEAGA
jgi:chemotaxis protein MotB